MIQLSVFQVVILSIGAGAAMTSWGHLRALGWIACLVAAFLVSSRNWTVNGPDPELVAGLCDASLCIALFLFAKRLWEMFLFIIGLAMLGINFLYLGHNLAGLNVVPHDAYATLLEILNIMALFLIGGVSAFQLSGRTDGWAFHPWRTFAGLSRPFQRPPEGDTAE